MGDITSTQVLGKDSSEFKLVHKVENLDIQKQDALQESSKEMKDKMESIISSQRVPVSDFIRNKLMNEQKRSWDIFYKHNTTNFFKDRHWTTREFPELNELRPETTLLELGCGVGNAVFPLLKMGKFKAHMCDISPRAIDLVKSNAEYTSDINAFCCDLTIDPITNWVPKESVDVITAIFVLSAIAPCNLRAAIDNILQVLKPGGTLLIRDYAINDCSMVRFKKDNYIDDRFYCRQDGTFTHFFTTELINEIFQDLEILENEYVLKQVVNRKRALEMNRIFLQARIRKNAT